MRLPKSLWRLLRSKRFHRFLIIAPFVAIVGVVVFYWGVNAWGQAKLDATKERMRELGIPLGQTELASRIPPGRGDLSAEFERIDVSPGTTHPETIMKTAGVPGAADWKEFFWGTDTRVSGDLRILLPNAPPGQGDRELAGSLLQSLENSSPEFAAALELVQDKDLRFPFQYDDDAYEVAESISCLGTFLAFRAMLHIKTGSSELARQDHSSAIALARRLHDHHRPMLYHVNALGILSTITTVTPLLISDSHSNTAALKAIQADLRSVDSLSPTLRALETDLGALVSSKVSSIGSATTLPAEHMRWSLDWRGDLDDWKDTFGDWWWQIRPAGFVRNEFSQIIEGHLDHITRRSDGTSRETLTAAEISKHRESLDPSDPIRYRFGFFGLVPIVEGAMHVQLHLRFLRLAVACELHQTGSGSYPESAETLSPALLPQALASPFTGEPLRLSSLPDGRLIFEGDSTDPADPDRFEYPAKP